MKTTFKSLSLVLILTILFSIVPQTIFATPAVDLYGIQPGTEEQNQTISITNITIKENNVTISGKVNSKNKEDVTCLVSASDSVIVHVDQSKSNNGTFSFNFTLPDWVTPGTYSVRCSSMGENTVKTFKLTNSIKATIPLQIVNTHIDGSNIKIVGKTNSRRVGLIVTSPDNKNVCTDQAISTTDGTFSFSFTMPNWAITGNYTIKLNTGEGETLTKTLYYKQPVVVETIPEGAESDIKLVINNRNIVFPDQQPIVLNDRTYVPVRFLAENLGATVEWDAQHQVVIISNSGIQYSETANSYARYYLRIGEPQMVYVAYDKSTGHPVSVEIFDIPEKPFVTNKGRTMLPFRFVSELLGAFIYYDAKTHSAIAEYNANKKIDTIYPVPILSTLIQDSFYAELMDFRLKNKTETQNPQIMQINKSDTLMAAATWKTLQLFEKYDHTNPDGTLYWGRFFTLYMPSTPFNFNGENIKASKFSAPLGIQLLNASTNTKEQYRYIVQDLDAYLDDSEYWYNHLNDAWGIKMLPLTETSDLVFNGKSYSKYKMNSQHYMKIGGVNFHSFSLIKHWNENTYRSFARQEVISWGNSFGHKTNMLSPLGDFGYGVRLINGRGYATYAKG